MKSRLLLLSFIFSFLTIVSFAQTSQHVCGSYDGYLEDDQKKYPEFYKSLEKRNIQLEDQNIQLLKTINPNSKNTDKKIIPVVVHVIHDLGSENISDEQIYNSIAFLNKAFNSQDDDFISKVPDCFAAVAGFSNIEFRLATIDPMGNPSSGINRVRSELTTDAAPSNLVKSLSYWNSYQYLNIWLVKKFIAESSGGVLQGYAQFPGRGSMSTDGVAILAGTFANLNAATLPHEVGHWLGLRHVWGDALCGDDQVADTPPQRYSNGFGDNPGPLPTTSSFPYHVGLQNQGCIADSLNWAGEMFMNYMDYTSNQYRVMFSQGQMDLMNSTLEGEDGGIGFREYMWQEDNLIKTGTMEGAVPPSCNKQADFSEGFGNTSICLGEDAWLKSNKSMFGSSMTSLTWDLGDGTTSNVENNLLYEYNQAGTYDVSLTINYDEITFATSESLSSLDLTNASSIDSSITTAMVQGTQSELNAMNASNITSHDIDSLGVFWSIEGTTFYRGEIENKSYTAYYNNSCASSIVKTAFMTVNSITATNSASSYSYDFDNSDDLINDWHVISTNEVPNQWSFNNQEVKSWEWYEGNSSSSSCIMMSSKDAFNANVDNLISPSYDLSGYTKPAISFKYTGAAVNTFPSNEVKVYYSNNCGDDWAFLGALSNIDVARAGLFTNNFTPNGNWADTLLTKTSLKNDNIKFKFEYSTNGASNNFFLDDIQIGEEDDLLKQNIELLSRIKIFPNPTLGNTNVILNNLEGKNIKVVMVDVLGKEVKKIFEGLVITDFLQLEANISNLDKGVYFISVFEGNNMLNTDKIILNK
jgi:hypothetical protein